MEKTEIPAVAQIEIVVTDGSVEREQSACWDLLEVVGYAFLPYSALVIDSKGVAWGLRLLLEVPGVPEKLGTMDNWVVENWYLAEKLLVQLGSKGESSEQDAVEHCMGDLRPLNLYAEVVRGMVDLLVRAVIVVAEAVAVAVVAAAVDDVLVPYNAGPIPCSHLEDYHLPYQRTPWESCKEECPRSMMSLAYLARSSSAPTAAILVLFSLLLASVCPPRLWHVTNFSLILRRPAIVVGELVADLKAVLSVL